MGRKKMTTKTIVEQMPEQVPEQKPEPVNIIGTGMVTIIGTGTINLTKGKEYKVTATLANTLINKGAATLKQ